MEPSLKGFNIYWDGRERVRAERETAPKHRYLFEVAADTQRIAGLIDTSDPDEDVRLEKEAGHAVEEFLRQEREGK
jgi:hypothetical protein